jgi:hypothetical protein
MSVRWRDWTKARSGVLSNKERPRDLWEESMEIYFIDQLDVKRDDEKCFCDQMKGAFLPTTWWWEEATKHVSETTWLGKGCWKRFSGHVFLAKEMLIFIKPNDWKRGDENILSATWIREVVVRRFWLTLLSLGFGGKLVKPGFTCSVSPSRLRLCDVLFHTPCKRHACCSFGLLFALGDERNTFLRNVGELLSDHTGSHSGR